MFSAVTDNGEWLDLFTAEELKTTSPRLYSLAQKYWERQARNRPCEKAFLRWANRFPNCTFFAYSAIAGIRAYTVNTVEYTKVDNEWQYILWFGKNHNWQMTLSPTQFLQLKTALNTKR